MSTSLVGHAKILSLPVPKPLQLKSLSSHKGRHRGCKFLQSSSSSFATATGAFVQPKKNLVSKNLNLKRCHGEKLPIVEWTFKEQQRADDGDAFPIRRLRAQDDENDEDDEETQLRRRQKMGQRRFIDKISLQVKAGNGGSGCVSFHRDARVARGPPNGGNGGRGGDVLVKATLHESNLNNLSSYHFKAQPGAHGQGKDRHGGRGDDCVINVPVGTVVKDITNPNEEPKVVGDLNSPDSAVVVAEGGTGGRGNRSFVTPSHRSPKEHTKGKPGDEKRIILELKLIADVGLVGYPNAGKSTFLCAISEAHPRVASYPFTTLHPTVGVVRFDDYYSLSVADLPGLIEGAHRNVGLGHQFLRHVERTKLLCYVIDMAGNDGRMPWDDFQSLRNELELYQAGLSQRPSIIVANKTDLPKFRPNFIKFSTMFSHLHIPIFPICAKRRRGLSPVMSHLRRELQRLELYDRDDASTFAFRKRVKEIYG